MLGKLYEQFGISDRTDFRSLGTTDYPILSDLYALIEAEYKGYDKTKYQLYPPELLQEILLGLHSMCMGAESQFFKRSHQRDLRPLHCVRRQGTLAGQPEREERPAV